MKLARIRQSFSNRALQSPRDEISTLLNQGKFKGALAGRKRVAIAVGSRGISNIVVLVKELVESLKQAQIEPVIVPAMGSHGGAMAEGQVAVLKKLGISEQSVGAKIVSSMEVKTLGHAEMDGEQYPVYVDSEAWQTDGVIFLNRVKTHTDFDSRYESGLVKMATVGLGNHAGATQVHSLGVPGLKTLMPRLARVVFNDSKVIGGIAVIEDAYHETAGVHWLGRDEILDNEPQLLEESKSLMPTFPCDDIDLLIVGQMGKNISGVGMDTKVLGRLMIDGEPELPRPNITLIGLCDITDESYGNALGVGLADFITRRLYDKIDYDALKKNILTASFYQRGKIPLIMEHERELMEVCLTHLARRGKRQPKVAVIKNTLQLADMYVSQAILDETKGGSDIEVTESLREIAYDDSDTIITDWG